MLLRNCLCKLCVCVCVVGMSKCTRAWRTEEDVRYSPLSSSALLFCAKVSHGTWSSAGSQQDSVVLLPLPLQRWSYRHPWVDAGNLTRGSHACPASHRTISSGLWRHCLKSTVPFSLIFLSVLESNGTMKPCLMRASFLGQCSCVHK